MLSIAHLRAILSSVRSSENGKAQVLTSDLIFRIAFNRNGSINMTETVTVSVKVLMGKGGSFT